MLGIRVRSGNNFPQAQKKCINCDDDAVHWHHVVPRAVGGSDRPSNLVALCGKCHGLIHDKRFLNHGELTRIGLAKAKAKGKQLGARPGEKRAKGWRKDYFAPGSRTEVVAARVLELIASGAGQVETAEKLNISYGMVQRILRRYSKIRDDVVAV